MIFYRVASYIHIDYNNAFVLCPISAILSIIIGLSFGICDIFLRYNAILLALGAIFASFNLGLCGLFDFVANVSTHSPLAKPKGQNLSSVDSKAT